MPLSSLFVLDVNGTVLISRDYRGDVGREEIENFLPAVHKHEDAGITVPVFRCRATSFAYVKFSGLYLISLIKKNANVALIFTFMHKFIEIASHYLHRVEEESIRDNLVVLLELLDEIVDFGYPQITDPTVLQTYIFEEGRRLGRAASVPAVVTNAVSWRPEGISYPRNELFIDVVESADLLVSASGAVLVNEARGCVKMRARLSAMPQLRLGLSDQILLAIDARGGGRDPSGLEDVKFHQCVQLSRISDKNVYFIPPDGDFELMSYRRSSHIKPLILIRGKVTKDTYTRLEYTLKAFSQFRTSSTANNVEIVIPVSDDVNQVTSKSSAGIASYVPERSVIKWKFKYLPGGTESTLHVQLKLSSLKGEDKTRKTPIRVKFMIPYFTLSGLQIKYVKIIEKSNYKALTWVRYTTQNGEYLVFFN